MIEGKRCAVAVNAPDVYSLVESGADGEVAGADAAQLAHNLYKELQNSYPTLSKELINGSFQIEQPERMCNCRSKPDA